MAASEVAEAVKGVKTAVEKAVPEAVVSTAGQRVVEAAVVAQPADQAGSGGQVETAQPPVRCKCNVESMSKVLHSEQS